MSKIKRIRYYFRKWFFELYYLLGGRPPQLQAGLCTILVYHGLVSDYSSHFPNSKFITVSELEKQLLWFKENCNIISINDLRTKELAQDRHTVILTFDDGFKGWLTYLLPLAEKHQVPVNLYITTIRVLGKNILWPDLIDNCFKFAPNKIELNGEVFTKRWNMYYNTKNVELKKFIKSNGDTYNEAVYSVFMPFWNENYMRQHAEFWELLSEQDLLELTHSKYITIGAHGVIHANQEFLSESRATEEMQKSKEWLENIIKKEVTSWAYPDASYSERDFELGRKLGYTSQLLLDLKDPKHNLADIYPRFGMNPYISWNYQINCLARRSYI